MLFVVVLIVEGCSSQSSSNKQSHQLFTEEVRELLKKHSLDITPQSLVNTVTIYCSSQKQVGKEWILNEATGTSFTYTFGEVSAKGIAQGILYDGYSPTINNQTEGIDGWMRLWVNTFTTANRQETDACYKSEQNQIYAAGMAEGLLTQPQIYSFFQNQYSNWHFAKKSFSMEGMKKRFGENHPWVKVHSDYESKSRESSEDHRKRGLTRPNPGNSYYYPTALISYMKDNYQWLQSQVSFYANVNSPTTQSDLDLKQYWKHIGLILAQFQGLVEGYTTRAKQEKNEVYGSLSWLDLYFLQAAGDMETLEGAIKDNGKMEMFAHSVTRNIVLPDEETMTDCSALIKITPDCMDLFAGHTTWRGYNIINKFYKVYSFMMDGVASQTVSFAASPSFLSSKDDFYVTEAGLVTMETTNDVFNTTLFQYITPKSVLCWMRSVVSNRLAFTAKQWVDYFAEYNSGTYNNQWMALDYKNFKPGQCTLSPGSLWILEQIPGTAAKQDVTQVLNRQTFWSSYNIPYLEYIYNVSGYVEAKQKFGDDYDYKKCPRSKIFEREQAKIGSDKSKPVDFKDFGRVLQYNEWKTDPFSLNDPSKSISSRYDLRSQRSAAFGGIDTKVTNFVKTRQSTSMWGICGPTHQDSIQTPPFSWEGNKWNVTHLGQPETYNFDWVDLEHVESFYSALKVKLTN